MAESTLLQEDNMIKRDRGSFALIFPNQYALSRHEIEEIFSRFGPIASITETGSTVHGYRFVRYKQRRWAVAAIAGLRDHPTVQLCAHQPKKSAEQRQRRHGGAARGGTDDDQCSVAKSVSSSGSGESSRRRNDLGSLPDLVSRIEARHQQQHREPVVRSIDATDLIVANIPHSSSAPYLLHIFHHFEPLAVSQVETTANRVRYCHVYFKSEQDAQLAEASFDRHRLMGNSLIVMRSDKLVQSCLGRASTMPKYM